MFWFGFCFLEWMTYLYNLALGLQMAYSIVFMYRVGCITRGGFLSGIFVAFHFKETAVIILLFCGWHAYMNSLSLSLSVCLSLSLSLSFSHILVVLSIQAIPTRTIYQTHFTYPYLSWNFLLHSFLFHSFLHFSHSIRKFYYPFFYHIFICKKVDEKCV